MRSKAPLLVAGWLVLVVSLSGQDHRAPVGRTPSPDELKQWDITVLPNGAGLPEGKGTAAEGEAIYRSQCASCHGVNGEGNGSLGGPLVGGIGTLASPKALKTIGSYWPYATSVWDYIHRAMPYGKPGTLTPDETYAISALLLYRNGIIQQTEVMTQATLPKVRMPNRDGFVPDSRPDVGKAASSSRGR
jgi:S-disulfanyl-L-cysteine oxidoreductase SoxD